MFNYCSQSPQEAVCEGNTNTCDLPGKTVLPEYQTKSSSRYDSIPCFVVSKRSLREEMILGWSHTERVQRKPASCSYLIWPFITDHEDTQRSCFKIELQ